MHKYFLFFLWISIALCPSVAGAQKIFVSDALSIRNDFGYEIIGRLRDRILLFRDKYDDFEIQAYDQQMQMTWSKSLQDIDKRGVQILAVMGGKNDFSVIFKARRRNTTQLRIHKYDPGANLIDSMILKDYGERVFTVPALDVIHSEDRNCMLVFNTAERNQLEATCFLIDKMQVLWDRIIPAEDNYYDAQIVSLALGNTGDFYLTTEYRNRRNKLAEHEFRILRVNAGEDKVRTIPLPDFLTADISIYVDNEQGQIVGGGLYGEKSRDRANGVFYLRCDFEQPDCLLHHEEFDENLLSILRRKDMSEDARGLSDAEVRQLVLREDGGILMIIERHHEVQRGGAAGRGFWRDGMRMVVDFYFDDLFVVALHPDGKTHWKTVLHKKQYSQDDEATFSSYFLLRNRDKLRFMFNDEIKYENTCSEYVVSPLGEFDRNSLLNTFSKELRLRFRDGLQISTSECLVPSEFRNKLRLVLIRV